MPFSMESTNVRPMNPSKSKPFSFPMYTSNRKRKQPWGGFEFERSMCQKRTKILEEEISEEAIDIPKRR